MSTIKMVPVEKGCDVAHVVISWWLCGRGPAAEGPELGWDCVWPHPVDQVTEVRPRDGHLSVAKGLQTTPSLTFSHNATSHHGVLRQPLNN